MWKEGIKNPSRPDNIFATSLIDNGPLSHPKFDGNC